MTNEEIIKSSDTATLAAMLVGIFASGYLSAYEPFYRGWFDNQRNAEAWLKMEDSLSADFETNFEILE